MGRTDAELIAAARAGDTAAFGQIVARYQPAVVAVAYAAVRDRVLAEDIAQDAFVTAWTKLAGLRDVERLPAWLCGIARNVARARRRVRGREVPVTDVAIDTATAAATTVTTDATPFTVLDDAQREAALATALARVPATYREPLVLVYCEQQSASEVARALGVSDAAVHQRLSRGRTMLAGDAQLVEHSGRRSRRDLAAAVLAAIAIGFGSSRVDAHPRPRGTNMLKLAAAGIIAALAGTTYVVAHASGSASAAPVSAPASAPSSSVPRAARSARAEGFARVATTLAAVTKGARAAAAVPSLDCSTVGRHMAEMAFAGQAQMPTTDAAMTDEIIGQIAPHFTAACEHQHYTQGYMACVLGSTDMMSAGFDCAAYAPAGNPFDWTDDGVANVPGAIQLPGRTTPVPPTTDTSCAGIGRHLAQMSEPDPAAITALPAGQREAVEQGVARATAGMPAQIEQSCIDAGWTEARRTCLAAATTATEMGACD